MGTLWPMQLPYGLSSYHRHVQTGGQAVALHQGEHPRWQRLTLQEISSVNLTTPNASSVLPRLHSYQPLTPQAPTRRRQCRRKNDHVLEMGTTEPGFQQPRAATATAKARRNKTPKPQSRCISFSDLANIENKRGERSAQCKPLEFGTRPGANQQLPITIDSEDDSDTHATLEAGASPAARLPVSPASQAGSHARRFFANSSNKPGLSNSIPNFEMSFAAPLRRTEPWSAKFRSSLLQREDEQLFEERLVLVTPSPCYGICDETTPQRRFSLSDGSPAQLKHSLAKAASTTPRARYKPDTLALRTRRAHSNTLARHTRSSSSPLSYTDNGIDLTLADITDFDLRQKTAQLMAVAPGLPVADLYHLLMERGGQFEATKQEVIRASQAPCARPSQYRPNATGRAAVVPCASPIDKQEEEKHIKIDLDDPAFMWDNDAPATPPPEPCRRKLKNEARSKKSTAKAATTQRGNNAKSSQRSKCNLKQTRRLAVAAYCSRKMSEVQAANINRSDVSPSFAAKSSQNHRVTGSKGKSAVVINRGMRATSYDLEFIVPDDQAIQDSDESYSESDYEHTSDCDVEDDGIDLSIDIGPEYALESGIL